MAEGNIYRATLEGHYTTGGVRINNVLWFRQLDPDLVELEEATLGQSLKTVLFPSAGSWAGDWDKYIMNVFVFDYWRVQRMTPGLPGTAVLTTIDQAGGSGSTRLPPIAALDCKLISTYLHRRGMGRLYLGGIASANADDGSAYTVNNVTRWSSGILGNAASFIDALFNAFSAANPSNEGFEWGVWSRTMGGSSAPYDPDAFHPMADFVFDPIIRCQRRREEGVGY